MVDSLAASAGTGRALIVHQDQAAEEVATLRR